MNMRGEERLRRIERLRSELTEWVEGRKSRTNQIRGTTGDNAWETMLIAQADAAEVVKLAAAIEAESAIGRATGWNQ